MIESVPDSVLQMKDINFAAAITLQVFLHHGHHHAITGTSGCFLNNPYLFSDNRHKVLRQEIYFTSVCRDNRFMCKKTAFRT